MAHRLENGSQTQLDVSPASPSDYTFASLSPAKATVDSSGFVTGVMPGLAVITITRNLDNALIGRVLMQVFEPGVEGEPVPVTLVPISGYNAEMVTESDSDIMAYVPQSNLATYGPSFNINLTGVTLDPSVTHISIADEQNGASYSIGIPSGWTPDEVVLVHFPSGAVYSNGQHTFRMFSYEASTLGYIELDQIANVVLEFSSSIAEKTIFSNVVTTVLDPTTLQVDFTTDRTDARDYLVSMYQASAEDISSGANHTLIVEDVDLGSPYNGTVLIYDLGDGVGTPAADSTSGQVPLT